MEKETLTHNEAEERTNAAREEIVKYCNSIGIDAPFISKLVDEFYARIQKHPTLGPIFAEKIEDWDQHTYKLKHFWASVTMNAGTYSGRPMPAHMNLKKAEPYHFAQWLELFEKTIKDVGGSDEAVKYFMERAQRIGQSFMLAMFYKPR